MKTFLLVLVAALVAFIAGWRFGVGRAAQAIPAAGPIAFRSSAAPAPDSGRPAPLPAPGPKPASAVAAPDEAGVALAAAIDQLTSPQTTFGQKQALREQLRKSGRLLEVIATLKQLAAQNPNDAGIPTALGEAELSQIRNLLEGGADPASSDVAILGLQADQSFNAALAVDPTNWEAQFEKAAAMAHWPPTLNKGPEVIQMLSSLVTQQEAAPAQPEYALTYAILGQQYQASGQPDKALQIWQQGLARFPLNPALQQAVARPSP